MPNRRPSTIWRIAPDASGDLARKLPVFRGRVARCNCFHFERLAQRNHRNSIPSATRRQPCAKTWNGSTAPGTTARPAGSGTPFMGTSTPSMASSPQAAENRGDRARRALRLQRLKVSDREDPFAAIIRCTADGQGRQTDPSKWSRVMRYAAAYKLDPRHWTSSFSGRAHQRVRRHECCSPTPWYFRLAMQKFNYSAHLKRMWLMIM